MDGSRWMPVHDELHDKEGLTLRSLSFIASNEQTYSWTCAYPSVPSLSLYGKSGAELSEACILGIHSKMSGARGTEVTHHQKLFCKNIYVIIQY